MYIHRAHDHRPQDDTESSRSTVSPIPPLSPITPGEDAFARLDERIDYQSHLGRGESVDPSPRPRLDTELAEHMTPL